MNGTSEKFIVAVKSGEVEKPVYVYEFSANETNDVNNATRYDTQDEAVESAELLNQMAELQNTGQTFEAKKVTTIIEGVE